MLNLGISHPPRAGIYSARHPIIRLMTPQRGSRLLETTLQSFLDTQHLPVAYAEQAELLGTIEKRARSGAPFFLAINGCQGSGKSTLAAYLNMRLQDAGLYVVSLSLDDFYLSQQARQQLANTVHPLFATRGVPGTHNLPLMHEVLEALSAGRAGIALPQFDKASDNPLPPRQWCTTSAPAEVVLMEGWCWGARAVDDASLMAPINTLERTEDPHAIWRRHVNQSLRQYEKLYALMHAWAMLKAPGFACVQRWRNEQEQKLIARLREDGKPIPDTVMNEATIARFVAHYQRLTERLLTDLPQRADTVWELDEQRNIRTTRLRGVFAQCTRGQM